MTSARWRETSRVFPKTFRVFKTDPAFTSKATNIWAVGVHRRQTGNTAQEDSMVLQSLVGRQAWNEAGGTFAWANTHLLYEGLRRDTDGMMKAWIDEVQQEYAAMRMDGSFKVCPAFTRNTVHESTVLLHRDDAGEAGVNIKRYYLWHRAHDDALWALGATSHVVHTLKGPVGCWTIDSGSHSTQQQIGFLTGSMRVVPLRTREKELADRGFRLFSSIGITTSVSDVPHTLQAPGELVLPNSIRRLQRDPRVSDPSPVQPASVAQVTPSRILVPIGF